MDGRVSASDSISSKKHDDRQIRLRVELEEAAQIGKSAWLQMEAQIFLRLKRITQPVCDSVPIRWDYKNRAMVLPIDAADPSVVDSVLWRRPEGWPDKWIGPGIAQGSYVFGYRHIKPGPGVLIFEGAHDILATGLLGYGIAILGSDLSDAQANFIAERWSKCVVWLDPDKAGTKGTRVILNQLSRWGKGRLDVETYKTDRDPKLYRPESPEVRKVLHMIGAVT